MPRPGPRPYECVRRAWHSDRHQPMRGSLIQEIFRVVNETHSSATKKNKEWQAKLPVVVLKAEEIMYSKANSEAEYMDFKTLWDRANDAINTIIRREENNETGDLLPPCIEAALVLGCTQRRASRSQRNSNPRCYLSSSNQEPTSNSPRVLPDSVAPHGGSSSNLPPLHSGNPRFISYDSSSSVARPPPLILNPKNHLHLESSSITQDNIPNIHREFPLLPSENIGLSVNNNPILPMQTSPPSTSGRGRVYPLFYGARRQITQPQFGFQIPQGSQFNTVVLDIPPINVQPSVGSNPRGILQNLFSCDEPLNASNRIRQADLRRTTENPHEIECDLSLRLGVVAPWASVGTSRTQEVEEVHSSSGSQDGSKSSDPSTRRDKGFCFFPGSNADDLLESSSSKWSSEGEGQNLESPSRKRKAAPGGGGSTDDVHFSQQPNFPTNTFCGRMKKPDT